MARDPRELLEDLKSRKLPTALCDVEEEVGPSVFELVEQELENETLVMKGGQVAAITPTAYYRVMKRIVERQVGR